MYIRIIESMTISKVITSIPRVLVYLVIK